jgi:hypothetical protein
MGTKQIPTMFDPMSAFRGVKRTRRFYAHRAAGLEGGGRFYRQRRNRPTMPCGTKVTIRMKMIPSHNSQRSG